jgi:hypothetical protein
MQRVTLAIFVGFVAFGASCTPAAAHVSQQRQEALLSQEHRALAECDARWKRGLAKTYAEYKACQGNAIIEALTGINYPFIDTIWKMLMEKVATAREVDARRIGYDEADARDDASVARMQTTISQRAAEILNNLRQLKAEADANRNAQRVLADLAAEESRIELLSVLGRMMQPGPEGSPATVTTCQWVGNQFQCVTIYWCMELKRKGNTVSLRIVVLAGSSVEAVNA